MRRELFDDRLWTGRVDTEDGELGLRVHQVIGSYTSNTTITNQSTVLLGFCSEEGVRRNKGRLGAKNAPDVIRAALANLPVHFHGNRSLFDAGNIYCEDHRLEDARALQVDLVEELLTKGAFPIVLGGGHETALGDFLALAKHSQSIGIINLDAHFDLRLPNPLSSSGTPFFEMAAYAESHHMPFNYCVVGIQELGNTPALFQRAEDLGVHCVLADAVHRNLSAVCEKISAFISSVDLVYLSLDMDVFDVAYAPGVSATTINGLTPFQIKTLIQTILSSGKVKLADVVEYNPIYDRDNQTAKLTAQMIYTLINA